MKFCPKTSPLFSLVALLALLLSSCAPTKPVQAPAAGAPSSLSIPDFPGPQAEPRDALVQEQEKLMSRGDYLAALRLAGNRAQEERLEILHRALPGAQGQAKEMLAAQNYAEAGAAFGYLLSLVKTMEGAVAGKGVSAEELARQRDFCAEQLMVQGMTAYRSGRLEEAIGTWEQILAFAPAHEAAQKSLATSRTQLANLKALGKEGL